MTELNLNELLDAHAALIRDNRAPRWITITDHENIPGKIKLSARSDTNTETLLVTRTELVALFDVLGAYLDIPSAEQAWDEGYMAVPANPEDRESFVDDAPNPYRAEESQVASTVEPEL